MKTRAYLLLLTTAFLFSGSTVQAQPIPEGAGIVYGQGFGFNLKAPKGWVLDNQSGVSQGLHVVFYPIGQTWDKSEVVAYAQSRPKTETLKNADDAAQDTIKRFLSNGNPNYQGKRVKTLKTDLGQEAVIYEFSGDQWGNYESAAYFLEANRINFIVMNSRNKALYDQSQSAFEALVKSYKPMQVEVSKPK